MNTNRTVNWHNIRTHNGSQYGGFEELCTQLARSEKPDDHKAKFRRLDDPDGGIECYWEDSEGNKWGWQAKYYPANQDPDKYYLKNIRWGDITKSIETALEKHPELTRYYVCIPKNLNLNTDGDWNHYCTKWEELAKEKNKKVEFEPWGASELNLRLMDTKHAGRRFYWFSEYDFSNDWFKNNLDIDIEDGDSAKPSKEPQIADKLGIIGRTNSFINQLKGYGEEVQREFRYLNLPIYTGSEQEHLDIETSKGEFQNSLETVSKLLSKLTPELNIGPTFQDIAESIHEVKVAIEKFKTFVSSYSEKCKDEYKKEGLKFNNLSFGVRAKEFDSIYRKLDEIEEYLNYAMDAENKRLMVISGNAGIGKTHLLCDFARKRVDDNLPTILLMGRRFTSTADPWIQVLELLDLSDIRREDFVTALESAAQASGQPAFFIIDAINDVSDRVKWNNHLDRFLKRLKKSHWIIVVLSVRTTYEHQFIPPAVRSMAICETHKGFEGMEYEAIQAFFADSVPKIPPEQILYPEFSNPLVLKFICEIFKGQDGQELSQFDGLSDAFERYQKHINENLREFGYDPDDMDVHNALMRIAERLVDDKKPWLKKDIAKTIVNQPFLGREYEQSLYYVMSSESVLIERIIQDDGKPQKVVQITYQLFADHIIARYLLQKYPNENELKKALVKGGELAFLLDNEGHQFPTEGIIEALSIQVPERIGKELIELAPSLIDRQDTRAAFRQSLIWRKIDAFSDTTDESLNEILNMEGDKTDLLDTLLTVATMPGHKYNAHFLHKKLRNYTMVERDTWWSIYLRSSKDSQGVVDRIVDWALRVSPDTNLKKEAVELASITLIWMMTSYKPFLRNRATKALVNLLTGRLDILHQILKQFADVNDTYVAERLYAVAYGVVMHNHDKKKVGEVALWVYKKVFAGSNPPAHILLRDYARGVIERALYLGSKINIDRSLIEPPYESEFPNIPTEEEISELVESLKQASYDGEELEQVCEQTRKSFMENGYIHIMTSMNSGYFSARGWLSSKLSDPWRSSEDKMEGLISEWEETVRKSWEVCKSVYINKNRQYGSPAALRSKAEEELKKVIKDFRDKLNAEQLTQVDMILKQWKPGQFENPPPRFELVQIKNYTLKRILELLWEYHKPGKLDKRDIGNQHQIGVHSSVTDSKYLWIAYYEIMAYISDHFQFLSEYDKIISYEGPWHGYFREMDPSVTSLINSGGVSWDPREPSWWMRETYTAWRENESYDDWLERKDDRPQIENLLKSQLVVEDSEKVSWLNLIGGSYRGQLNQTSTGRIQLELSFKGCFVRNDEVNVFVSWAKEFDTYRGGLPDIPEKYMTFLGEYGWSPAFKSLYGSEDGWIKPDSDCPVSVRWSSSGFSYDPRHADVFYNQDVGADHYPHYLQLPNFDPIEKLELRWTGCNAEFVEIDGKLAVYDPTATEVGPSSLLFREDLLRRYLKDNELTLCWLVRGKKDILGNVDGDSPDWQSIYGVYVLGDQEPQGSLSFCRLPREILEEIDRALEMLS